jgi:hypothetical protein
LCIAALVPENFVDIGRGHHRYRPFGPGSIGQSFLDPPSRFLKESLLASGAFFAVSRTHSKDPLFWLTYEHSSLAYGISLPEKNPEKNLSFNHTPS